MRLPLPATYAVLWQRQHAKAWHAANAHAPAIGHLECLERKLCLWAQAIQRGQEAAARDARYDAVEAVRNGLRRERELVQEQAAQAELEQAAQDAWARAQARRQGRGIPATRGIRLYRWMGAYYATRGVGESLAWELGASVERASAARVDGRICPLGNQGTPSVCLEYSPVSSFAAFRGDCYSVRNAAGKLYPTRGRKSGGPRANSYGQGERGILAAAQADQGYRLGSEGYLECLLRIGSRPIKIWYSAELSSADKSTVREMAANAQIPAEEVCVG